ncbi:hypothetical protein Mapa_016712 [Marchantia paleacea]|nr:hypothetical protein Mapa_016712 [Marchantia paleacea]
MEGGSAEVGNSPADGEQIHIQIQQSSRPAHALVIPLSVFSVSHVTSAVLLSAKLAKQGITVTVLTDRYMLPFIHSLHSPEELQSLDIRLAILDHDESERLFHQDWSRPFQDSYALMRAAEPYFEKLASIRALGIADLPTCVIADMFCLWAQKLAQEVNLPSYAFFPSGANLARLMQAFPALVSEGKLKVGGNGKVIISKETINITGLPPFLDMELPNSAKINPVSVTAKAGLDLLKVNGVIINTFYEIEIPAIEAFLQTCDPTLHVPKVFTLGPLASPSTAAAPLGRETEECMEWLDRQPVSSVVYICFGSQALWTPETLRELALALEASHCRFLWVLYQKGGDYTSLVNALPEQFQARVGERGRVATYWVPQVQVILHQALSCFMSHCGWNSTVESISGGVPMLCVPRAAEQHLNCRHIVDVLKVGIQVKVGDDGVPKQKDIESALRIMMAEEEGKMMRQRVLDLKLMAAAAAAPGGSSSTSFQELIHDLKCT